MEDIELNELSTGNIPINTDIAESISSKYKDVEWTSDHEQILVEWADKAMCYRWLHARSHQSYSKTNTWFTIPVIIMSTLKKTMLNQATSILFI